MGRPKGSRNQSTYELAGRIWDLCAQSKLGLTKKEICYELEISDTQFSNAIVLLREMFQEEHSQPIVYMPKTHRYVFNASEADSRKYGKWMLTRWETQVRRSQHYVHAVELKFGESRRTTRLRLHTELLLNSLEEMLEAVEAQP